MTSGHGFRVGLPAQGSSFLIIRTPRPFICSKNDLDLTLRMKTTISTGLMSVPVANHVHGDGDARHGAGTEGLDRSCGVAQWCGKDLLGEVVTRILAQDLDDVLGVVVVLGEEQGLGDLGATGEDLGELTWLAHHGADLVRG